MNPNPRFHSALHVLKGAVIKILVTTLTKSVYAEGNRGRLTVAWGGKVTEEQMSEIETLANKKIEENVSIEMIEMTRRDLEEKYEPPYKTNFPSLPTFKISS